MILKKLLIIITIVSTSCNAFPTDVDDFDRLVSSLSKEKTSYKINITNEKLARSYETLLQESGSPFLSHFIHNGNNFFFKPNIVIGTNIEKSKQEIKEKSKKVKKHERKKKLSTSTTTATTTTAPTTMTIDSMKAEKIDKFSSSENKEKEKIKVPEQPFLPKPVIVKESEPVAEPTVVSETPSYINFTLPPSDLFSENVEYILLYLPMRFRNPNLAQKSSVSPALPKYQETHKSSSEKNPQKAPQLAPIQLPVSVIVISSPEIVDTRLMPNDMVSKESMEIPNYCIPQVLAKSNNLREKDKDKAMKMPSPPAFWAHNIALARALPKIMPNKEKIYDPYRQH